MLTNPIRTRDDSTLSLLDAQTDSFAGWQRPSEVFHQGHEYPITTGVADPDFEHDLFSTNVETCDLVQDVTTDCSVVAGLSAAMNILIGSRSVRCKVSQSPLISNKSLPKILSSIFHPFDRAHGRPAYSASGKYIMRFNFNGCDRKVVVDDRLPASSTERTFYVVDRTNKRLLWPALLEKAYLKVRGGYDFPGSNSGTDLWVVTGWIPEQIFLQR